MCVLFLLFQNQTIQSFNGISSFTTSPMFIIYRKYLSVLFNGLRLRCKKVGAFNPLSSGT